MKAKRINVSVPPELYDRVEAVRGDVSRSKFVQRALESALGTTVGGVTASESSAGAGPASSRASAPVRLGKGYVPPRPKGA